MEGFLRLKQLHRVTGSPKTRGAITVGTPGVGGTVVGGTIPLAFNDSRFAANTPGSTADVTATTTYANKTWDDSPLYNTPPDWDSEAPFDWNGSGTTFNISKCRWKWREGFRAGCDANAILNMSECYIECVGRDMTAFGAPRADHSDCFQVYSVGGSGVLNVSKTCFRGYSDEEALALYGGNFIGSAGLMYADDFQGQLNLTDVVFWGGTKAIELYADVGVTTLRFNNVYFVPSAQVWPSAGGNPVIMAVPGATASLIIAEWNNVRAATIVNGVLVPGALIPEPTGNRITNSTGGSSSDPGLFNTQTDTFSIEWDAVPNGSPIDVVTGVSSGAPTAFSSFACSLRFNSSGAIDARNGGSYAAANTRTYAAGVSYHCKMTINTAAKTYSAWVTPAGGAQVQIANNYDFRTEQANVSSLNYLGKMATTGDAAMTNMIGPPVESLPPVVSNATFSLTTTGTGWAAGKVVGTVTATRNPTSWAITAGNGSGYFAISNTGVITVTSAGASGLANTSGVTTLSVQASNASGTSNTATATINRSTSSSIIFPASLNDPMFTGMTERSSGSTLNAVAGTTYNNLSWLNDQTDSWTILCANNITFNKLRIRTREGPRFRGYTNVVFNNFYLEVFGLTGDHADGHQWEGGANSATWNGCHIRCTSGAFTGCFVADGSTGTLTFVDCLFSCAPGGGTGLIIYADNGFGSVKLSMKNCYFQQTGWGTASGPFLINRADTTSPAQVILWDNVRYCNWDHTNGILTPGNLIPQPSGT